MNLLLLSQDLMISARVTGAARQHGLRVITVTDHNNAIVAAADENSRILLVDLRLPGLNIGALVGAVRDCREEHLPIVACGPHVHEARLAAAREAGCDAVVTRGQFDREAEAILKEVTNGSNS